MVATLSSADFGGRRAGTPGGEAAAAFLKGELARLGAAAVDSPPLVVSSASLTGSPRLVVGGVALRHRVDFNEWPKLGRGGVAEGRLLVVDQPGPLPPLPAGGWVLLLRHPALTRPLADLASEAGARGFGALLLEQPERPIGTKSVSGGAGALPVLYLTAASAEALGGRPGAQVRVELPLEVAQRTSRNVVGLVRRAEKPGAPTFLLAAHYDHLGDDSPAARYPGAFDNASGVAVVLEAVRRYQALSAPGFDLLVAFTTGEESGMTGSLELAAHPPASIAAALNVDGVGSQYALRGLRMGQTEPRSPFASLVASVLLAHGIEPYWRTGSDDSRAFLAAGIPTVGLGEEAAAPNPIHTPADRPELLNAQSLERAAEVILDVFQAAGGLGPPPASAQRPADS
jgi:Iap family predicted aminopeptidase